MWGAWLVKLHYVDIVLMTSEVGASAEEQNSMRLMHLGLESNLR